ncbi:hypothetical protein [Bacillus massiliglaciei]|uniref:hypothetical protein n=1 Tax=Bacillus massiliglaciei TaxID=1816693 RepID=UPI000DA6335B|nr:hypothetical protein [Bacillus massiliglaciei]
MNFNKMFELTEKTEIDTESLITKVNTDFLTLYQQKNINSYTETLKDLLELAVHLEYDFVLKYFGAAPIAFPDERYQFQEIFKCMGTRKGNKDWFLNLFSLFLGTAAVFNFDMSEVEKNFLEEKDS